MGRGCAISERRDLIGGARGKEGEAALQGLLQWFQERRALDWGGHMPPGSAFHRDIPTACILLRAWEDPGGICESRRARTSLQLSLRVLENVISVPLTRSFSSIPPPLQDTSISALANHSALPDRFRRPKLRSLSSEWRLPGRVSRRQNSWIRL